ncbi:MAG: hypothetical protein ABI559_05100 [Chloroflexota bacterium]
MNDEQIQELPYQALETEIGGQKVYKTAITCAQNAGLKKEWQKYLEETVRGGAWPPPFRRLRGTP